MTTPEAARQTQPNTHGGQRPGASRRSTLGATKQVVIRVPIPDDDKMQAFARLHNVKIDDVYRQAVRDFVLLHEEAIALAETPAAESPAQQPRDHE